jgi:hypothetical protein
MSSDSLVAVLFNGGGDIGDNVLCAFDFLGVGHPLITSVFSQLNFFKNCIHLFPIQAHIAIGMISKNLYLYRAFSSPG